jgi:hypothetical protein
MSDASFRDRVVAPSIRGVAATRADASSSAVIAGVALAMATGAAVALAAADVIWLGTFDADGAGAMLLSVIGWTLLVWAALVGVAVVVHLVRSAAAGRRLAPIEIVLLIATAAVVSGVLIIHPLVGSGQGFGGPIG